MHHCEYCDGLYHGKGNGGGCFDHLACSSCIAKDPCNECRGEGEVEYHTSHSWFSYCETCKGTGVHTRVPKIPIVAGREVHEALTRHLNGHKRDIQNKLIAIEDLEKRIATLEEAYPCLKTQSPNQPVSSRFSITDLSDS